MAPPPRAARVVGGLVVFGLLDHQVHERALVIVLDGEVEIVTATGDRVRGGRGLLLEFAPNERHAAHATSSARLLLLLTP